MVSSVEILEKMKTVKDAKEYRRWHVLLLVRIQKMQVTDAAKVIGISRKTIYDVLARFDEFGVDGMPTKPRGGRVDSYLSWDEEKKLLEGLLEDSTKGLIVTAKEVKKVAEKTLQHTVNLTYAYDLLHRHGWRKIKPRPKHPKGNKQVQEEFKKKFHLWSKNV